MTSEVIDARPLHRRLERSGPRPAGLDGADLDRWWQCGPSRFRAGRGQI